jgi:hypothetical protein
MIKSEDLEKKVADLATQVEQLRAELKQPTPIFKPTGCVGTLSNPQRVFPENSGS